MIEEGGVFWTPDRARPGVALLREGDRWLEFSDPIETRVARTLDEVVPLLEWAEAQAETHWAVGYVRYEAAPAFDSALSTHPSLPPFAQFSIYAHAKAYHWLAPPPAEWIFDGRDQTLIAEFTEASYLWKVHEVQNGIADGRNYQTNLTFRCNGVRRRGPIEIFLSVIDAMDLIPPYTALLIAEGEVIMSWSPELFFARDRGHLICKPMKGTRPSDGDPNELHSNPKDQAENLMIVDMIRNDLGKIAMAGSVRVSKLFEVERHATVLQMTSTIESEIGARRTVDVFRALFPCASVVGAPKVETSRIIVELESSPRGIYCGAIGFMAPGDRARFSVAIRTMTWVPDGTLSYGTGSGIVHDSVPQEEYRECITKLGILMQVDSGFALLETLPGGAAAHPPLVERHLDRMEASAARLRVHFDRNLVREKTLLVMSKLKHPKRVRVTAWPHGLVEVSCEPITPWPTPLIVQVCSWPVLSCDEWLKHKTTRRVLYDRARAACPNADEVILWNERDEVCEFTVGNIVVELDGELWTPPVECGLLPGIQRAVDLESGKIKERVMTKDDLQRATKIWHINSVRGWTECRLIDPMV